MATTEELKQLKNDLAEYRKTLNESIQVNIMGEKIDYALLKISLRGLFGCFNRLIEDLLEKEKIN